LDRSDVSELHCIMPIANMASVMELGVLSHNRAENLPHESAAMQEIQDRRAHVTVPGGLRLHDYANLYFHARNPMMRKRQAQHESLCVISVSHRVLDLDGTVVSDKNAAADFVRFAPSPAGLVIVDKELTYAVWWTDPDYYEQIRRKQAKQAEVLVPHVVAPEFIRGAYVSCDAGRSALRAQTSACKVKLEPDLFLL
jgi:ssDNA thymidine ADP-ribosyltransferase, DarT